MNYSLRLLEQTTVQNDIKWVYSEMIFGYMLRNGMAWS